MRAAVESGRSDSAYAHCAETDTAADTAFDLWCGIAAVDVGRPAVGVLALERYVLTHPDDVRGRLELARAYFYAGDDRRSRREFEAVLSTDPPETVRVGIRRYLDALRIREREYLAQVTGYVEGGGGYDSNVNGGVAQAVIGLPVLGQVSVINAAVGKSDGFGWLSAGMQLNRPVAPGASVFATLWGNGTFYASENDFDLGNLGIALGGRYQTGLDAFALTYAHAVITLDEASFRRSDGIGFEWRRQVAEQTTLAIAPQFARLSYHGDNAARDANFSAIAVALRRAWLTAWQPVATLSVYGADEHNRESSPWLGRKLYGVGGDVSVAPASAWTITAAVGYQRSNYDGPYPILDTTRHDDMFSASVGATYLFGRAWSARLEYQYTRNRSNLDLFDYDRDLVAIKLRHDFY
ncbi:MAG TPA: outer membrane beta-barrel protein [Casimicrobiaceae bacterium]|nr:outer membrane beta-barrel protein [Casimicrobiaceae bacterium]